MTIELLQKIKEAAGQKLLRFLVLNQKLAISPKAIAALKDFGVLSVAVENGMELSKMNSMFPKDPRISFFIETSIPIQKYDVIIGYSLNEFMLKAVKYIIPKYVLTFRPPEQKVEIDGYNEIEAGCYQLNANDAAKPKIEEDNKMNDDTQKINPQDATNMINDIDENDSSNYDAYVEKAAAHEVEPPKKQLRYLFDKIDGRVSIVMTLTGKMGNFAQNVRSIKAQNLPDYEIIVVDNHCSYKHNLKVNLKFANEVPADYAADRGRELTTGSYIFMLTQDSECPDINEAIVREEYDRRD